MNLEMQYKNKYFSIFGDSISTLERYNPPDYDVFYDETKKRISGVFTPEDTWWGQTVQTLGGKVLVNNSFSGSIVCKLPAVNFESYGCSDSRTSKLGFGPVHPDVIIVFMGINDWGRGIPVFPTQFRSGLSVFSEAYEAMLTKMKQNYPNAEIWCLTLPRSYRSDNPEWKFPDYFAGRDIAEYCQAIQECGKKLGCKVLDIHKMDNLYDTIDGYHPNAEGMRTISSIILAELAEESK